MKFLHAYGQVLLQLRAKQKPPSTVKLLQILQQLPLFLAMQPSNYLLDNDLFLFVGTNRSVLGKRQKTSPLVARLQPNFSSLHLPLPCPYYAGSIFNFIH